MAYLDVESFNYDGVSSDSYNLKIGWFEGDLDNDTSTGLTIELKRGDMNMVRTEPNQYGAVYTDTLTFEFAVINKDKAAFTKEESHKLNAWLRGSNTYKKLIFQDNSYQTIVYYAVCTDIVDVVYNGVNGKKLTFVCNSPFGFMPKSHKRVLVNGSAIVKLNNMSDKGVYFPTIKIIADIGTTVRIINQTDNNQSTSITFNQMTGNTIIINGEKSTITDGNGKILPAYAIGWSAEDIYWTRMLQGRNTFEVVGNCDITFEMEFPRKVGSA